MTQTDNALANLLAIMAKLRDPVQGCPWDRKQTLTSLVPHTLEEAYEVADVIERQAINELPDELGDLLFQIVFYAQLGQEQSQFSFDDVVHAISDKLVRRHPHVFADSQYREEAELTGQWEQLKAQERRQKNAQAQSVLDDIPLALPALSRAKKIQQRCSAVGFDWQTLPPVVDKINEELAEVLAEVTAPAPDEDRIADELGDLLFASVNLVRHLKQDPEAVLRRANDKFERRYRQVEQLLQEQGKESQQCSEAELDGYWQQVKAKE